MDGIAVDDKLPLQDLSLFMIKGTNQSFLYQLAPRMRYSLQQIAKVAFEMGLLLKDQEEDDDIPWLLQEMEEFIKEINMHVSDAGIYLIDHPTDN